MKVLRRTLLYIHMQSVVRMVVVVRILHVNGQVLHFTCALADAESPQHGQRLPQKDSQQEERTQAMGHTVDFIHAMSNPMTAQATITWITLRLNRNRATAAPSAITADTPSKPPPKPCGHNTW